MNKQLPPPAEARNPRVKDLATEVLRVMPGLKRSAGEWRSSSHEGLPSAVEDRARLVPCVHGVGVESLRNDIAAGETLSNEARENQQSDQTFSRMHGT
jgi:hypothetical protein